MPFITEALDDVHEPKPAPDGEYELQIIKAEERESKNTGREMMVVSVKFVDPDIEAPPFQHYLLKWTDEDDDAQVRMRKLEIKRFCQCFDLPPDFGEEDLAGATGLSYVVQEEGDDGVVRNRMRLPKLKE